MNRIFEKLYIIFSFVFVAVFHVAGTFADALPSGWKKYSDPKGRFAFHYPSNFGKTLRGTNSGFGNRVTALRFTKFSAGRHNGKLFLGGEAVLTKGRVTLDIQAAGGLYDSISMEMFAAPIQKKLIKNLVPLKASNFCQIIARQDHIDLKRIGLRSLSAKKKNGIRQIDRMRNLKPKLVFCKVSKNTVIFNKMATFQAGSIQSRQHIYGAIRFLKSPYSSFQIISGAKVPPGRKTVASMKALVDSIKILK